MSEDRAPNGTFGPGNTHTFAPGVGGGGKGRAKKPPFFAEKARIAAAWFHGFAAGTANDDARKALEAALTEAWAAGHIAPRADAVDASVIAALVEKHLEAVTTCRIEPSKEQLFAAVKVIEWEYGKAQASVEVTGEGMRVTTVTRVIVDSNTAKGLPAGEVVDVGRDRKPA